jgi:hypothetical protein
MTRAPAVLACMFAAAGMLAAAVAWGQHKGPDLGDHDWIQAEPRYLMQHANVHCCDMSHCRPLDDSDIRETREGWLYIPTGQVFRDGEQGTYQSRDRQGRFFGCGHSTLWCFFFKPVVG